jgi:hypothetical protein
MHFVKVIAMWMEWRMPAVVSAVIMVTTSFLGCIEITTESKGLSITNFQYCSDIRGSDDYDTHEKTYMLGEQIFMYFELEGFKKRDDESAQIYQTLTIIAPNGVAFIADGVVLDDYVMIDQSFDATGMGFIWFDNHLPLVNASWQKGTYEVTIFVEDKVANRDVTYATDFIIA